MSDSPACSQILRKAAQDVRLLVAHAARDGKAIDAGHLSTLISAVDKISNNSLSAAEEAKFWKTYADLAKLAEPARVDSLYIEDYIHSLGDISFDEKNKILSGIRKHQSALKKIRVISIFAFIATLIILAYLSISESLIARNTTLGREYQILSQNIVAGTTIEGQANLIRSGTTDRIEQGSSAENGESRNVNRSEAIQANVNGLIAARKHEIVQLIAVNDQILSVLQFSRAPKSSEGPVPYNVITISKQQNINAIISGFILPTIAAVLGVTVFLLRTASTKIQDLSFRANDAGIYWHRLVLGVVGGISISWFSASDKTGIFSSITPAALAFLVGYSVEVLYNILDSLVKALGGAKHQV